MPRNELDTLVERLEGEARRRNIPLFRAHPIWDDDHLTTVQWQSKEGDESWRQMFDVIEARKVTMLMLIVHAFHESAFEPTPPSFRRHLTAEGRIELEEQEQLLAAARGFAGQTGRVEIGWIEGSVFYVWGQETDWYTRVWELVMSRPFEGADDDD